MSKAGAPKGNKNAAKAKTWEQAIKRALARTHGSLDEGLIALAEKLVAAAGNGDQWALKEIGDRVDGKSRQSIESTHTEEHKHYVIMGTPEAVTAQEWKEQTLPTIQ